MQLSFNLNGLNQTIKLGESVGKNAIVQTVILMHGDLGAGKTTFTKGIAKGLNIAGVVNSPTFNILKCYFDGDLPLYHIDAYRLEGMRQDLGFEEYIEGDGVCLIEWSNFIDYLLPEEYLSVEIYIVNENERKFVLEPRGNKYEKIVKEIETVWKK